MSKYKRLTAVIVVMLFACVSPVSADDSNFFKAVPYDSPDGGSIFISNMSFYSPIRVNSVLKGYGVKNTSIISSITDVQLGITDYMAFTGSIPFYADMFKQNSGKGEKTGPGDISLGLRMTLPEKNDLFRGFSFGSDITVPEKLSYDAEPLGFRTFSPGELSFGFETSVGLNVLSVESYVSASYRRFPKADNVSTINKNDLFYDTGSGLLGIGTSDVRGLSSVLYQDQITYSMGSLYPFTNKITGIFEMSATTFLEKEKHDSIYRIAPAVRFGKEDGLKISVGIDFGLKGPIPDRTFMVRLSIPSFSPNGMVRLIDPNRASRSNVTSQNSLVAIDRVSKSEMSFAYENELMKSLHKKIRAEGILKVIPEGKVTLANQRRALSPVVDSPERLGIRLGANYVIKTEVLQYNMSRTSSFQIPLLIGFPETVYTLSASTSVVDLTTGKSIELGVIEASVKKSRGVKMFPMGPSSDLIYLSAPERIVLENKLIEVWVENFNDVLQTKLEVFGWTPKQTKLRGEEDVSG